MRRVVYGRGAQDDLDSILDYLTERAGDERPALRFTDKIRKRCRELASLPGTMGRSRPELAPDLRSSTFGNHVIFFRYVDDTFYVINVLEGHRDLDAFFSDEA